MVDFPLPCLISRGYGQNWWGNYVRKLWKITYWYMCVYIYMCMHNYATEVMNSEMITYWLWILIGYQKGDNPPEKAIKPRGVLPQEPTHFSLYALEHSTSKPSLLFIPGHAGFGWPRKTARWVAMLQLCCPIWWSKIMRLTPYPAMFFFQILPLKLACSFN